MPAFSVTSLKKPKKGASASIAYSLYQRELDLLNAKYKNPFTNKISSSDYFEEKKKLMERALNNPSITPIKKTDIMTDKDILEKDRAAWDVTSRKQFNLTVNKIKETLDDNWKSIWQNADILRSGNIGAMAQGMLDANGGINDIIGQLEEVKSIMSEVPGSEDAIDPINKNIEFLEDRGDFWRGLISRPDEYAVTVDSASDGAIKNFEVKNIADTSGYQDTGATIGGGAEGLGGFSIYGKPHPKLTDDSGLETIVIGGNVFKGDKDGYELQNKEGFDLSTLRNVPFGNYSAGSVLKAPNGAYRVMGEDGNFTNYNNQQDLERAGFSVDGAIGMTEKDFEEIDSMYDVSQAEQTDLRAEKKKELMAEFEEKIGQFTDDKYKDSGLMIRGTFGRDEEPSLDGPFKKSTDESFDFSGSNRTPTAKPNKKEGGFLKTITNIFKGRKSGGGRVTEKDVDSDTSFRVLGGG